MEPGSGEEGTTWKKVLKEQVLDTLIQTHIMNQHAEEYQVSLTEEETDKLKARADSFYERLS